MMSFNISYLFKTYEFFTSGFFHAVFSDCGWQLITETGESKTTDNGGITALSY